MPETPTDAFSTLKLNTPLIDLTEDKNDNSFLPQTSNENATPKRKIAPKKKIQKISTVTEIKIVNKAGVPPQRKIKINPVSVDEILNETFLLQEKPVESMEVDPNPLTFSVDTVTSKKKKGETGRPLSTKTQHKNLIESKRKVKESASSAAENDSDSTVITVTEGSTNEKYCYSKT
uniref:Uncharacterized protein n=1 Tax=Panagrolaimus superbus TaxID=310955 RepID=A0A914YFX0_9BILA